MPGAMPGVMPGMIPSVAGIAVPGVIDTLP